jgi:(p)ppGpp synthase/HD superfamily hydrolase
VLTINKSTKNSNKSFKQHFPGKITDTNVLCAAFLHDTVEDTDTTIEEIQQHFGKDIAHIVAEVTDDKNLPKAVRKQKQVETAPHKSHKVGW